jgi:hypothetical protein
MEKNLIISTFIILSLLLSGGVVGQNFSVSGSGYSFSLTSADITDAGLDFASTHTSLPNQSSAVVSGYPTGGFAFFIQCFLFGSCNYQVLVEKSDINWDPNLTVSVVRTGGNNVNGGLSFIPITNTPQLFYNGTGNSGVVNYQYRVEGVSVLIPADTYSTDIVFTFFEP